MSASAAVQQAAAGEGGGGGAPAVPVFTPPSRTQGAAVSEPGKLTQPGDQAAAAAAATSPDDFELEYNGNKFKASELKTRLADLEGQYDGSERSQKMLNIGREIDRLLSTGKPGIDELRKGLDDLERALGGNPPGEAQAKSEMKPIKIELDKFADDQDKSFASSIEAVSEQLVQIHGQYQGEIAALRQEMAQFAEKMQGIAAGAVDQAGVTKMASASVQKVKAELGIDLTPAKIEAAIKETRMSDPVDACRKHYWKDVKAALTTGRTQVHQTDLQIGNNQSRQIDRSKMSISELMQHYRENPDAVRLPKFLGGPGA